MSLKICRYTSSASRGGWSLDNLLSAWNDGITGFMAVGIFSPEFIAAIHSNGIVAEVLVAGRKRD